MINKNQWRAKDFVASDIASKDYSDEIAFVV